MSIVEPSEQFHVSPAFLGGMAQPVRWAVWVVQKRRRRKSGPIRPDDWQELVMHLRHPRRPADPFSAGSSCKQYNGYSLGVQANPVRSPPSPAPAGRFGTDLQPS